jgi:hypothetical protein
VGDDAKDGAGGRRERDRAQCSPSRCLELDVHVVHPLTADVLYFAMPPARRAAAGPSGAQLVAALPAAKDIGHAGRSGLRYNAGTMTDENEGWEPMDPIESTEKDFALLKATSELTRKNGGRLTPEIIAEISERFGLPASVVWAIVRRSSGEGQRPPGA